MHHSLRFYAQHRERFLVFYIFFARWTRVPLIGRLARWAGNRYGEDQHAAYLLTPGEAEQLVDLSPRLFVGPCSCRQVFHHCDRPVNTELMLGKDHNPFIEGRQGEYRPVDKNEARQVLANCHAAGLVPTLIKCRDDFYAMCNCCTCCCVPLRLKNRYGIGRAAVRNPGIVPQFQAWLSG